MNHDLRWVTPSASWGRVMPRGTARHGALDAPSILAFGRDDFMEALIAHLNPAPLPGGGAAPPGDLGPFALQWESSAQRPSGAAATWRPTRPSGAVPKLFHPAHGRFYLAAASLVCRVPGLPDHAPDLGRGDRVGFFLRRVRGGVEEAWVPASTPNEGAWVPVPTEPSLPDPYARAAAGEELRSMFPVAFTRDGARRRIWAGLIPVASRETYRAPQQPPATAPPKHDDDVVLAEPRARVRQGLSSLRDTAAVRVGGALAPLAPDRVELARFLLVDLAELLTRWLPAVYDDLGLATSALPAGSDARRLRDDLAPIATPLRDTWDERDRVNGESPSPPTTTLAGAEMVAIAGLEPALLDARIVAALGPTRAATPATAAALPRFEDPDAAESRYVVRCVLRPHDCGPARPDLVGAASERFVMASFYDGDAPARPIRISLPVDTTVRGLRRSPRNVAFVLSKGLRNQMARLKSLGETLDGKLDGEGALELGEICSLSIPIITLCAFIVLFIFLVVLNIVFWWLPFIKICFPIPRRSS